MLISLKQNFQFMSMKSNTQSSKTELCYEDKKPRNSDQAVRSLGRISDGEYCKAASLSWCRW